MSDCIPTLTTNLNTGDPEIRRVTLERFDAFTKEFMAMKLESDFILSKKSNGGPNPYETEFDAQLFNIKESLKIKYPDRNIETIVGAKYRSTYPTDERRVPCPWWFCGAYVPSLIPDKKTTLIATQGPPAHTLEHFLFVVDQQKVDKIVMLAPQLNESKGIFICERYWPLPGNPLTINDATLSFNEAVALSKEVTECKYSINIEGEKEPRMIKHIQYSGCEDFGVPDNVGQFVELVYRMKEEGGLQMIHCDAGIGRTGMYCAIHLLIEIYEEGMKGNNNIEFSVPNILIQLRKSRDGMVSNWRQYKFIYDAMYWLFEEIRVRNFS